MTNQTSIRPCWVGWGNALVYEITAGAPFTFSLGANPTFGQVEIVKDILGNFATNNVTVVGANTTIDGQSAYLMNTNYAATIFYFNGSSWDILGTSTSGGGGTGSETGTVISAGGTYTLAAVTAGSPTNYIITTTSAVMLNIPAPNTVHSWGRVNVTDASGNPNVIVTPASGLINGAATALINTAYGSSNFLDFGIGWAIQ